MAGSWSSGERTPPLPTPPQFTPGWDFRRPGDCGVRGHVALQVGVTSSWRCVLCDAVMTSPTRPAPPPSIVGVATSYFYVDDSTDNPSIRYGWSRPDVEPCVFDQMSPEDRSKPWLISCSCPRCSPRCEFNVDSGWTGG